jgi:hypothetical protein
MVRDCARLRLACSSSSCDGGVLGSEEVGDEESDRDGDGGDESGDGYGLRLATLRTAMGAGATAMGAEGRVTVGWTGMVTPVGTVPAVVGDAVVEVVVGG